MPMLLTNRNHFYPKTAIDSLFYIKNHWDDDPEFQEKCQEMINSIFEKFPGLMPLPNRLLSKQCDDFTNHIAFFVGRRIRSDV